jgi:hypothetical protein
MGAIIGALNLVALGICFYLLAKGNSKQTKVLSDDKVNCFPFLFDKR